MSTEQLENDCCTTLREDCAESEPLGNKILSVVGLFLVKHKKKKRRECEQSDCVNRSKQKKPYSMIHVIKHAQNFISLLKCCNTINLHIHTERVAQQHFACKLSPLKKILN